MKRFTLFVFFVLLFSSPLAAQGSFSIKAQPFIGFYIDKSSNIERIDPDAPKGVNLGVEFPSSQQRPWQQYLNNPTIGVGFTYMDFGADMMGHTLALYPYILFNGIDTDRFDLKVKLASGLGYVNEHWYTQEDTDPDHYGEATTNTTFGCYINAYLNAGLDMDLHITRNIALTGEFGFTHMSNGRTFMPNVGANIMYGGLGILATIDKGEKKEPIHFPDLPYGWSLNMTGASGFQTPDVGDRKFLIASFHAGAVYSVNNWYGVGPGVDVFYNGAVSPESSRKLFRKDIDYTFTDKMRVGLALNNEFRFGAVTAILDWGAYFFNPSRNYYISDHPVYGHGKRPLFYKSEKNRFDEGWNYFRFGLKCRVWDNLYLQVTAKTHRAIAEYIEFGIGYQIPFFRKDKGDGAVFHYRKGWWNR